MRRILIPVCSMLVASWIGAAVAADAVKQGTAATAITDDVAQKYDEMEKALELQYAGRIARAEQEAADPKSSPAQRSAVAARVEKLRKDREKSIAALREERAEALAEAKAARR